MSERDYDESLTAKINRAMGVNDMGVTNYVYVLLRKDLFTGEGYDADYPVEAVFLSMEHALDYRDDLIKVMREDEEIDEDTDDDDVFEIVSRPIEYVATSNYHPDEEEV
jgi:hypothetical protein